MAGSGLRKAGVEVRRRTEVLQGLDRQAARRRLHRPDQFGHGEAHGVDHRHRSRACRCSRSGPEQASSPGRSWRRGVKPSEPLRGRIFARISSAICGATFPASTSSRAMPSTWTRRSATGRGQTFDCVVSGVPLLNFPVDQARRLSRKPARPHSRTGRPVVQLTYGPKSPVPPGLGDYTVEHFRLHPAQHPADAALGLPPRQAQLSRRSDRVRSECLSSRKSSSSPARSAPAPISGRTADAAMKELALQGADVTRISLGDYPLPIMDQDLEKRERRPRKRAEARPPDRRA